MSRRRRTTISPNLFPFLAVLVCTLGTLILLLALVAQDARESAEQVVDEHAESARLAAEEQRWQAAQLIAYRDKQTEELEQRRGELAHLEDHLRRLREELATLQAEVRAADRADDESQQQDRQRRIAELTARIEQEKQQLQQLGEERKRRPPRVIIVPYSGPNGTDRRPIYIECTDEAVIIQPEGVRITPDQMRGATGPGNPLDAALRTVRAHWAMLDPNAPPPYPLLLIRPSGIHAYFACRNAMTAWDDHFGYELIPGDLELAFPKADPALSVKVAESVERAAQRNAPRLAANSPQRQRPRRSDAGNPTTTDAPPGTPLEPIPDDAVVTPLPESIAGLEAGNSAGGIPLRPATGAGGNGLGSATAQGTDSLDSSLPFGSSTTAGIASGGSMGSLGNEARANGALADSGSAQTPTGVNGNHHTSGAPLSSNSGEPSRNGDGGADGGADAGADGGTDGGADAGADGGADGGNPLDGAAGALASGSLSPGGGGSAGGPDAPSSQTAISGLPSPSGGMQPMSSSEPPDPHAKTFSEIAQGTTPNATPPRDSSAASSSAATAVLRAGNQWALPESMRNSRGITIVRQMRMLCTPDRFVLMPESKDAAPRVFMLSDAATDPAVEQVATAMQERIASWGLAMQNGRWDPVLVVTVAPGAEDTLRLLERRLENSGIRIEREGAR